jgi:hypothetical protein
MPSNLKLVTPTIPALEAAVARNRAGPQLRVPDAALRRGRAQSMTKARAASMLAEGERVKALFSAAPPFPGVVPKDEPKMALDSQTIEVVAWSQQWAASSALAEGQGWLGYQLLSELAQRPEYRAITETIAYEMTREGIEFQSAGKEKKTERIKRLEDACKRLKVMDVLAKAAVHDGFFGRGHVYIDTGYTSEREELKTPIGDGRGALSKLKVSPERPVVAFRNVEPVWTYPTSYDSANPLREDWYKPTTWFVMGTEIHATRLLTFIGREVPDLLKPAYSFGGLSMSQMAMPYVQNWLRTRQAVADLIWSFTVFVLKTNLGESMQGDGQQLFDRAELFNLMRNNQGLMILDKDLEEFDNVSASLAGLENLQAATQEHMSSVSKIPLVKLLGIQPAGLNASSEGEIRTFYDWIAAYQEHFFRDNLNRMVDFVQLSEFGDIDPDITYDFKQLWQLDEAGEAAVVKTRADTREAYLSMGAVTADEVREAIAGDKESPFNGLDLSQPLLEPDPLDDTDLIGGEEPELGEHEDQPEKVFGRTPGEVTIPKVKDPSSRLATSLTSKAANFGGATTGGFPAKDVAKPD